MSWIRNLVVLVFTLICALIATFFYSSTKESVIDLSSYGFNTDIGEGMDGLNELKSYVSGYGPGGEQISVMDNEKDNVDLIVDGLQYTFPSIIDLPHSVKGAGYGYGPEGVVAARVCVNEPRFKEIFGKKDPSFVVMMLNDQLKRKMSKCTEAVIISTTPKADQKPRSENVSDWKRRADILGYVVVSKYSEIYTDDTKSKLAKYEKECADLKGANYKKFFDTNFDIMSGYRELSKDDSIDYVIILVKPNDKTINV